MKKYLFIFVSLLCQPFCADSQIVSTQYGPVEGHLNGTVHEFLGIPYASPPIDTLRWKPPTAHVQWTNPIVADSFPPACPQKRFEQGQPDTVYTLEGVEDCLYLNVWTPDISANYPVMVFIHGGGNQQGSTGRIAGGTEIYHGKNLAERGDVVVVTIQYRLGALGYLVHPGLEIENENGIAGNYGVMDQIFALQWVQENISAFGGNPENVTIFGESAGGVNVGNLMTSPMAVGLFHKAIIQSAAPVINEYTDSRTRGIEFVNEYILSGTDSVKIAYMRTVPPDSITIKMKNPLSGGVVQMNWQPVLDDYVFFGHPVDVFQSGAYNQVPLMIGSNSEEMSLAVLNYPDIACALLVDTVIQGTVPSHLQSTAYDLYPKTPLSVAKKSAIAILTDPQFTATARRTAQCVSVSQVPPVWRYFFTHKHTFSGGENMGSYHGMELFYVFNNWENATLGSGFLFKPADDSVQQVMLDYWVNFAYTGNPNNEEWPVWPQYDASTDCYMELKATPNGFQTGIRTEECNLWDSVSGFSGCPSPTLHQIILPRGWSGVSSYLSPINGDPELLFWDILNELIIIQNETGMFYPPEGINTFGSWQHDSGYMIKVSDTVQLTIHGLTLDNRTLQLKTGWNLIPVLSECNVEVTTLFSGSGLIIAKEIAGWNLYWPLMAVNTLSMLKPGRAYYVLLDEATVISFPECE